MGNEMNELRYLDLKNALCEKIYEGIYKDGKKIPSERQLSTDYEVSRITVRKTLELMEKENHIFYWYCWRCCVKAKTRQQKYRKKS